MSIGRKLPSRNSTIIACALLKLMLSALDLDSQFLFLSLFSASGPEVPHHVQEPRDFASRFCLEISTFSFVFMSWTSAFGPEVPLACWCREFGRQSKCVISFHSCFCSRINASVPEVPHHVHRWFLTAAWRCVHN